MTDVCLPAEVGPKTEVKTISNFDPDGYIVIGRSENVSGKIGLGKRCHYAYDLFLYLDAMPHGRQAKVLLL